MDALADVKAAGSADSGPNITESAAKPPPFKDHTFLVRVCNNLDF